LKVEDKLALNKFEIDKEFISRWMKNSAGIAT